MAIPLDLARRLARPTRWLPSANGNNTALPFLAERRSHTLMGLRTDLAARFRHRPRRETAGRRPCLVGGCVVVFRLRYACWIVESRPPYVLLGPRTVARRAGHRV